MSHLFFCKQLKKRQFFSCAVVENERYNFEYMTKLNISNTPAQTYVCILVYKT